MQTSNSRRFSLYFLCFNISQNSEETRIELLETMLNCKCVSFEEKYSKYLVDRESLAEPARKNQRKQSGLDCVICYSAIQESAVLECGHRFCLSCTMNWSEKSDLCPLCKTKFTAVLTETGWLPVAPKPSEEISLPYEDTVCEICGSGEDEAMLLMCDRCDRGFHTYCVELRQIPLEDWFCRDCRSMS